MDITPEQIAKRQLEVDAQDAAAAARRRDQLEAQRRHELELAKRPAATIEQALERAMTPAPAPATSPEGVTE